jgi:integrase
VSPHVLRHTAITTLIKGGIDLPTVPKFSGHKALAMVLRYTHLTDDQADRSVGALDAAFLDAITPELHIAPSDALRDAA